MSENNNNIHNIDKEIFEENPENGDSSRAQETAESNTQEILQNRVHELENQLKEKDQKYIYLYAEFENYKKRLDKEKADVLKFGWESVARDMLLILDNFERALQFIQPEKGDKNLSDGLQMILKQFQTTLDRHGVKIVESLEKPFDPYQHEAVGQESSGTHPEGTIIKEHTKGYLLNGRLLRPAQVVVSKA